jgi:ATP adenylyltransferase
VDRLWAPWRLSYVTAGAPPAEVDGCFICGGLKATDDRANLIALRTSRSVVVLNRYPYNNGHLLIAPQAHKARPEDLSAEEALDLHEALCKCLTTLDELMSPHGYNVGLNLGKAAGAGLPGHLHWHVVPRWNGDTNFMPVLSDVRVIVQSLEALYELLEAKWRG